MTILPFYMFALVASIILGLCLIAFGAYLWLVAKKILPGLILLAAGLVFAVAPIAFVAFFTIASSVRG